ncbi:MAG: NAD(P)-dependent oxidoreductase [Betaproteobacteria bacterium]|nr:NAD(P)-dependent oxidoreductase [Betaproteobacteria bacterium]
MELNNNIGITSPGDMGQGVAMCIKALGFNVCMASDGRSARTRELGEKAGLTDLHSLENLVKQCDMVLSVLDPGAAVTNAKAIAAACKATQRKIVFVECNAIAPGTMQEITGIMQAVGCTVVDAGIIGPPPRNGAKQRFYVSGPHAQLMQRINSEQVQVRVAGEKIGNASAVKMCYAALTKGSTALGTELLIAARKLGVDQVLENEFLGSQADKYDGVLKGAAGMPFKAYRWVPEMNEIAKTFGDAGMTPKIYQGAAELYAQIATTPQGKESPEQARAKKRSAKDVINGLADSI